MQGQVIFDFNKKSDLQDWIIVDDVVMGGESLSTFKLNEDGVKQLMRNKLKASSYKLWRKRVNSRKTKHLKKRGFNIGKHFSPDQNKLK